MSKQIANTDYGLRVEFATDVVMGAGDWVIPAGTTGTTTKMQYGFGVELDGDGWPDVICGAAYAEPKNLRLLPANGEVRGASRLAGEASSREAATSTVVLGAGGKE